MNYKETADRILELVGGKENVVALTHCITRLRFNLVDEAKADTESIKALKGVKGVVKQGGQYQVIIGNEVEDVYNELTPVLGNFCSDDMNSLKKAAGKKNLWSGFTGMISQIFIPFLGVFTACGILKGLLTLAVTVGIMTADMGVYIVLYSISDSVYYFMPILVGASAAEYFDMNKYIGMIVAASMIYPDIIALAGGEGFTFLGIPMGLENYTTTVFPALAAVWFASLIHKGINKVCPKILRSFLPPLVTLVISVPVALWVVGPVLNQGSNILLGIMDAIYNFSPILCALVLGGPWMVIVMLGLHWAFIPLFITQMTTMGSCPMMGLLCANQFSFAAAMLAVAVKAKNDPDLRALGVSTGITCLLGVSEPGMYGVLLPLKKPFITAVIAGSLGAIPAAIAGTSVYQMGASGIFAFTMAIGPNGLDTAFWAGVGSMVAGAVLGFVLTYFFGIPREEKI